jgi:hypothetical protein
MDWTIPALFKFKLPAIGKVRRSKCGSLETVTLATKYYRLMALWQA